MDLDLIYQRKARQAHPGGWLDIWTMERQTMDHAAANLAKLVDAVAGAVKSLVLQVAGRRRPVTVPAQVAVRPAHVPLTAQNDDRAAA